jgi:hypothetical protein
MQNFFISSLLLFFLIGCKEDFPTYASPITTPTKNFTCLNYIGLNNTDKQQLQNAFGLDDNSSCAYRVNLTRYYVGKCDNPVVKSVGGDFNGYIRVEVKKGFKCYYKVQSDFKHDAVAAFDRVVEKVKIDLNQGNKSN